MNSPYHRWLFRGVKMDECIRYLFSFFVEIRRCNLHEQTNLNNTIIVSYRLSLINSIKHYSSTQLYKCIDWSSLPFVACVLFKGFAWKRKFDIARGGNLSFHVFVHIFVDFHNLYLTIIHTFTREVARPGEKGPPGFLNLSGDCNWQ